jgi:hypothetical protein
MSDGDVAGCRARLADGHQNFNATDTVDLVDTETWMPAPLQCAR